MKFSHEITQKINSFAKEQSQFYLEEAQMTYLEKLRKEARETKRNLGAELSRFKVRSTQSVDAQNDMIIYMSDYIADLMNRGMSEKDAFEKAKTELTASGDSEFLSNLNEKLQHFYGNQHPAIYEAIGLFYGGSVIVGMVLGGLISYVLSGGWREFINGGWIDVSIGVGVGILFGVGVGVFCHAFIAKKQV